MTLRSLAILFTAEDPRLSVRYTARDGPSPGTKARRREVQELARRGLTEALEALDAGGAVGVGTSGFTQREDVLQLASPVSFGPVEKGRSE